MVEQSTLIKSINDCFESSLRHQNLVCRYSSEEGQGPINPSYQISAATLASTPAYRHHSLPRLDQW